MTPNRMNGRGSRVWSALAALGTLGAPLSAQGRPRLDSIMTYQTVQVANGIYAFITPEERSGFQAGNSIVVVGDDGVLVVDTGNLPSMTRRQIADIHRLTDKPIRFVVNTHWHPDHTLGNAEYRAAVPGVTIVSTAATRANMIQRIPVYFSQERDYATTIATLRQRIETGRRRDGSTVSAEDRAFYAMVVGDYDQFMPEINQARIEPSNLTFEDSLTLMLGTREVDVLHLGRGNTAGDAVVYVPDAKVLVTGDLITFPCPFPSSAFLSDWIQSLARAKALGATAYVPGHGPVQRDYAYFDLTSAVLISLRSQVQSAVSKGLSLDDTRKQVSLAEFRERFAGGDTWRGRAFDGFFVPSAIERAYYEAKYLAEGPG